MHNIKLRMPASWLLEACLFACEKPPNQLKALSDSNRPEHEELLEWVGEGFGPEAFDIEEVNASIKPFRRRKKKR